MKKLLFLTLLTLCSTIVSAASMLIQEYPITPKDLITFSASQIQVRLCTSCGVSVIQLTPDSEYYEQNSKISLQRATELYVSPAYDRISLHINNQTKTLLFIRFGEFIENPGNDSNDLMIQDTQGDK